MDFLRSKVSIIQPLLSLFAVALARSIYVQERAENDTSLVSCCLGCFPGRHDSYEHIYGYLQFFLHIAVPCIYVGLVLIY